LIVLVLNDDKASTAIIGQTGGQIAFDIFGPKQRKLFRTVDRQVSSRDKRISSDESYLLILRNRIYQTCNLFGFLSPIDAYIFQ
jgi:hypothetical protein